MAKAKGAEVLHDKKVVNRIGLITGQFLAIKRRLLMSTKRNQIQIKLSWE